MKKKLLLFARDPGGANTIIPIVEPLRAQGYEVLLAGKDVALTKYAGAGLKSTDIKELLPGACTDENLVGLLQKESPAAIITGTSADDKTENRFWKAAEALNIPSFAILDSWTNYGLRFSPYSVAELEQYNLNKTHPYLPTRILVMDEVAKQGLIDDGIAEERMCITGQPYFQDIFDCKLAFGQERIQSKRSEFGIKDTVCLVTFASEPISKTYKEADQDTHYWGYTERTMVRILLQVLEQICRQSSRQVCLVLKQHPKEDPNNYLDIIAEVPERSFKIVTDSTSNPRELILSSDLICGMSSMFLLESVLLGKPTVSIQIGLCRESAFILDNIGALPSILTEEELQSALGNFIHKGVSHIPRFSVTQNPVQNVIKVVEEFI